MLWFGGGFFFLIIRLDGLGFLLGHFFVFCAEEHFLKMVANISASVTLRPSTSPQFERSLLSVKISLFIISSVLSSRLWISRILFSSILRTSSGRGQKRNFCTGCVSLTPFPRGYISFCLSVDSFHKWSRESINLTWHLGRSMRHHAEPSDRTFSFLASCPLCDLLNRSRMFYVSEGKMSEMVCVCSRVVCVGITGREYKRESQCVDLIKWRFVKCSIT